VPYVGPLEQERRQALVLGHVAKYPGLTMHEISRGLRLGREYSPRNQPSGAGAPLRHLEAAGLVERVEAAAPGPHGKRITWRLA
jgi:hypothetical protein